MTKELKPCPLHKEIVMPELSTYEAHSLTPWCATILCPDCGLELSVHEYATEQDAIDAITNMWNTRYKRTCEMEYSGDPKSDENPFRVCSKCGAYNIDSEYYSANGHRTVMKFCPECGAEVEFDGR